MLSGVLGAYCIGKGAIHDLGTRTHRTMASTYRNCDCILHAKHRKYTVWVLRLNADSKVHFWTFACHSLHCQLNLVSWGNNTGGVLFFDFFFCHFFFFFGVGWVEAIPVTVVTLGPLDPLAI